MNFFLKFYRNQFLAGVQTSRAYVQAVRSRATSGAAYLQALQSRLVVGHHREDVVEDRLPVLVFIGRRVRLRGEDGDGRSARLLHGAQPTTRNVSTFTRLLFYYYFCYFLFIFYFSKYVSFYVIFLLILTMEKTWPYSNFV